VELSAALIDLYFQVQNTWICAAAMAGFQPKSDLGKLSTLSSSHPRDQPNFETNWGNVCKTESVLFPAEVKVATHI
jgi:hypothetical protein